MNENIDPIVRTDDVQGHRVNHLSDAEDEEKVEGHTYRPNHIVESHDVDGHGISSNRVVGEDGDVEGHNIRGKV